VFQNAFAQSIEFISKLTCQKWILTNIYDPSTPDGRVEFLNWFKSIVMPDDQSWIIVGDFNLIQIPKNRNRLRDDSNMMMAFNDAISKLGVIEIPLSGQEFTWTNKQKKPLLERLDWFFISQNWSVEYPGTRARTLARDVSDHVPCEIIIRTEVPKSKVFNLKTSGCSTIISNKYSKKLGIL
jgi:endonuclease/exonuclease/phosphatase family metal-dependent hydrolase